MRRIATRQPASLWRGWPAICAGLIFLSAAQAGDILRGGAGGNGSSRRNAEARANSGAEAANVARTNARDRLARTTAAISAVRAMQKNVNTTAVVPDGMTPGGLVRATGANARWTGAADPVQAGGTVNVRQTESQAVLHWEKFNVGRNTTLNFDQSAGRADASKWVAFNKVMDPSGQPSQILGAIKAQGQVYVVNQNGIIFGAGSQVNTRALVASSLPINDNLINNGLLNNPDAQYLFSAIPIPAGAKGTPAFIPMAPPSGGPIGDVVVEPGALIQTAVTDDGNGGRVMLVGPNVRNQGVIQTEAGQTILAAGLQVGIDAHSANDPSLRGLDVFIGVMTDGVTTYKGESRNEGIIEARRGNITMAGKHVAQMGAVDASTSVDLNGRIDLQASYNAISNPSYDPVQPAAGAPFLPGASGFIELGPNSVTRVLPEWDSLKTFARTELPLRSQVNMQGQTIYLGKGSSILAPSAQVDMKAGIWILQTTGSPRSDFVYSEGQIYVDENALVDVAGSTDVFVPMAQNILTIQLRGSELRDSPLQRDGPLRARNLTIDLRKEGNFYGRDWIGTPLGDATGFAGLIERDVAQLTTKGGDITMRAGGSVVLRKTSIVDASGGFTVNESGRVQTSRLREGGHLVNIEDATPDRQYDGIYDGTHLEVSSKWGVQKKYAHSLAPTGGYMQREYIAGADAGTISITAPSMALDGEMAGRRVIGPRQIRDSTVTSSAPKAGRLELIFEKQDATITTPQYPLVSPLAPQIVFKRDTKLGDPGAFQVSPNGAPAPISAERQRQVVLSPDLLEDKGFNELIVRNSDGNILVGGDVTLRTAAGGVIDLSGANVDVLGSIIAPGGRVALKAYTFSPYQATILASRPGAVLPPASLERGKISLSDRSILSAAGMMVDERPTTKVDQTKLEPITVAGGSVSLEAFSIDLAEGSVIDVSGGAAMASNALNEGAAGSIEILAGQDPGLPAILGGELKLGAVLRGYSGVQGGSLSIKAPLVQVGGVASRKDMFVVQPEFFNRGGFASFTLTGIGAQLNGPAGSVDPVPAMNILPGTIIAPVVDSVALAPYEGPDAGMPTYQSVFKPVGVRNPVSLKFAAVGASDNFSNTILARGDVVLGEGAVIRTDPLGAVAFDGETVEILGSVFAPGGTISIKGGGEYPLDLPGPVALATVYIGPNSVLSAAGTTVLLPDPFGRKRGAVLPGGTIEVSGNIVAEAGAVLDVSGAAGVLDLTDAERGVLESPEVPGNSGVNAELFALKTTPVEIHSNGGRIVLEGSELLVSEATLLGRPGGPKALGGFLSVSSGRYVAPGEASTTADINLEVTQSAAILGVGKRGIGMPVTNWSGQLIKGMGYFTADRFAAGGFSSLELGGNVQFRGPISIAAERALYIADGGVVAADDVVNLSAAYIKVGQDFLEPRLPTDQVTYFEQTDASGQTTAFKPVPTTGVGMISLNAPLIDVGTLVMKDIGRATFSALNGDIRGNGTLAIAGDLILRAGQIYPTTGSAFNIFAADANGAPGSVTIEAAGVRPMPYSVGGSISIMAGVINQGGTLRAPLGSITIGWDGVGTAPTNPVINIAATPSSTAVVMPTTQVLTLGSSSVTSVSLVDPTTGEGMLLPYGLSPDGLSWLAPSGLDVTVAGLPAKGVSMAAQNLQMQAGSVVDLRGGGDLYAYRWVNGNGGSKDLLATEDSYAIIPGYNFNYAPYAPFNSTSSGFGGDPGYVNSKLSVGDQIQVSGSEDLPAGVYTLLPARYALLPGAVLIKPRSGPAQGLIKLLDGSSLVAGFKYNGLVPGRGVPATAANYEVISGDVLRERAEYHDFFANAFFADSAAKRGVALQRLPQDAGNLTLQAVSGMRLDGNVLASAARGGRGAAADIAATADIWITNGNAGPVGAITLNAGHLSSWGIESLLIGATRQAQSDGTLLNVRTSNIVVDNAGSPLAAPEVILAARQTLTLAPNAEVSSTGGMTSPSATLNVAGNGALLRVTSDGGLGLVRTGVTTAPNVAVTVGAGAKISGGGITVDSSYRTEVDPDAILNGHSIALNSGQVIVRFDDVTRPAGTYGLLLAGNALDRVLGADVLSLLSYSTFDIYGTGQLGSSGMSSLSLRAGDIRGFNQGGGVVNLTADDVLLDNSQASTPVGVGGLLDGSLVVDAGVIRIGRNTVKVSQFANVVLSAANGVRGEGVGGLETTGNMLVNTPVLTAAQAATQRLAAQGTLTLQPTGGAVTVTSGLGATYTLVGSAVDVGTDVILPSGALNIQATSGDLRVNGLLDLAGTTQTYYDVVRYTDGGIVNLRADGGDVVLGTDSVISVAASTNEGRAGSVSVTVPQGVLMADGELKATGGTTGKFALDVSELASLADLNTKLDAGSFFESRSLRVHTGNVLVDGLVRAHEFSLYADQGSITVAGTIDASGEVGGEIALGAHGSLTLLPGSLLTVAAERFSNAGKGGNILLEAGTQRNGVVLGTSVLDIQTGSVLDLSVASLVPGSAITPGSSAFYGQFAGTLHLRAPQTAVGTDLQVNAINGTINGASSILVEGYRLYDLTASGGTVSNAVKTSVMTNGNTFLGAAGTTTASYLAMRNRLLQNNGGLESLVVLAPGAELINRTGDITLGTSTDSTANDWDLSTFRFGPKGAAGVLTMRAAGNLVLLNSLSDGFSGGANTWLAPLMAQNPLLPINTQSWSYRLTAGADLAASSFRSTLALSALASGKGSLMLGKNYGAANFGSGSTFQTATAIANGARWQVVRTGSGDIDITAGRDVQLLNQFASIYTAGTQVADPTTLYSAGDFSLPVLDTILNNANTVIGRQQQLYPAQYSMAGGNVSLVAGGDIARLTRNSSGLIDDSSRQLPMNWLYRRGYIDPVTGEFGRTGASQGSQSVIDLSASTTWWVDFSNFFEGVGALGGGDVTVVAGNDVRNIDAVAPTNARMAGGTPDASRMVELGGGDVTVSAGRDISGGVYYVERGLGTLTAGGSITTNRARSPSMGILSNLNNPAALDPETWLPTTLFVGRGGFDVRAKGDVLMGPVANLFLMPSGIGNKYWYKTYFSTMGLDSFVNVTSLGGNITHRLEATLPNQSDPIPILRAWLETQNLFSTQVQTSSIASNSQPWLRLSESTIVPFGTTLSLTVPQVYSSALSGSINVVGDMNLYPSPVGTLEMVAAKSIEGLHSTGLSNQLIPGSSTRVWTASSINVSDANPFAIPSVTTPFSYHSYLPANGISPTTGLPTVASAAQTATTFFSFLDAPFSESGSYIGKYGVIQTKQALHASGILHLNDANPVRLYAAGGNIQSLELFTPKRARIFAERDITDVAFYLQNTDQEDVSVVAAGRDLVLYNASTERRALTNRAGNSIVRNEIPLAGDIQIAGPGALQVLAGRHIDLGAGSNNVDGTGVGITSIGNSRNPFLPFGGASIYAGAGLGEAFGLSNSHLNYEEFLEKYGAKYGDELSSVDSLNSEILAQRALDVFFLTLRDAGRAAVESKNYDAGYEAIAELFGDRVANGNIDTRSRDIRTKNGGGITIFVPGGDLTMASTLIGTPQTPPGIVTEYGGGVSIFTQGDVSIGQARIFTLRGGDIVIWSSEGDIAAGSAAKTVQTAPPTRVLVDPQSALVETDLAGLATGGGIGVLSTVANVPAGDVDLIAPQGTVDAGDAGIRATGNVNIAATTILNADTIQAGGNTTGVPTTAAPAAPNVAGLTSASNTAGAQNSAANDVAAQGNRQTSDDINDAPSIYEVQVLGYGGEETSDEEEEEKPQGSG